MVYYEILEDGTIGRSTNNKKIAQSLGLSLQTEKEIVGGYDGKRYFKGQEPQKSTEMINQEIEEARKQLYIADVDPLTSQIQRLRDEEQTNEIAEKIEQLITIRNAKVKEIKDKNPYIS